ncbi:senescence-associated family protein, partial [Striga hermonthica]
MVENCTQILPLDLEELLCTQGEDENSMETVKNISSGLGLAEACKYVSNDAKFVNERARSDIVLLSRGIMKLDARARQDVAFLGSEFLKLDARAKEDTVKVDHNVKRKAERLHHVATILKNIAQSRLKSAADKHWNNGALEADLKRADFVAKQRAIEDSLMALEFLKNIHDMMVTKMCRLRKVSQNNDEVASRITLEKNGKTLGFFPGEVSTDRINAIQEANWSIASALSEADGIDYTDPEELELLVAALIDLDAMDGKSSVSLLAKCSSSPDVSTRALANALSAAPSMWTLVNADMGALQ